MVHLAHVLWPLGDVPYAVSLIGDAEARIAGLAHVGTRALGRMRAALFAVMRGDMSRAAENGVELARFTREQDLPYWRAFGVFLAGLAGAQAGTAGGGLEAMRRGAELLREQNVLVFDGLLKTALAEAEARGGDVDRAVAILDEALATSERTGHRTFDAELHRVRGEMLLKRDPANPATAEEALQTAIAVAKQQATRSFELRAALSLAKLYQSTGRPADACDVLRPALAGFSPTPEFPQIAEAKALFEALAESDEWKASTASRELRLKLQTSYGQAMAWSKGFAAEETKTALVQTERLVAQSDNVAERMKARYARYLVLIVSGEARSAQDEAARFLREAKKAGDLPAVCSAERALALTCLFRGQLSEARQHSSEALRADDPGWEASARRVHGPDYRVTAKAFLAVVDWLLGDAAGAAAQFQEALAEAMASNHAPTIANTNWYKAHLEAARGDPEATRRAANAALEVAEKISLQMFVSMAGTFQDWARARLGDADGLARFRGHSETLISQTFHMAPLFYGRLAELEAEQVSADTALTSIDRAIESARKGDVRYVDSLLHRIRADILLKAHPDDPAPAEQAYLAAIAVAREQGARSFGLQAALKLAKLYQSTARPVEAHDLLVPALEGFSPTPEMPEIAEAQAMLEVARQFVSGVRFGVSSGRYPTAVDLPNGWFTTSGLVEALAVARRH